MKRIRKSTHRFDHELDLHGYTSYEAELLLEEEVIVHCDSTILVIHGFGEGVLRRTVRSFAAKNKNVKSFCSGEEFGLPGGAGTTILYT